MELYPRTTAYVMRFWMNGPGGVEGSETSIDSCRSHTSRQINLVSAQSVVMSVSFNQSSTQYLAVKRCVS